MKIFLAPFFIKVRYLLSLDQSIAAFFQYMEDDICNRDLFPAVFPEASCPSHTS